MMIKYRTGLAGFFILAFSLMGSACSSSSSTPDTSGGDDIGTTDASAGAGADTETETSTGSDTDTGTSTGSGTDTGTSTGSDTDTGTSTGSGTDTGASTGSGTGSEEPLAPSSATGADLSGAEDDSPTATETASLVGPFIKDTSRSAGSPPSIPEGLTLLLSSEQWLEFTWAPSSDDQSIEAYEIYRDGDLIATVRGDTSYEHDYRSWLSTTYMDCNFTRYNCDDIEHIPGTGYSYSVVAVDNEGMRSDHSAPAVFSFTALESSPVNLDGYAKVFADEFNGDALERQNWKTSLPWGPDDTINGELQYFVNVFGNDPLDYTPFNFTGETLKITGDHTPAHLASEMNGQPYASGVLSTSDHFAMTYGYVEMRAKVASGDGLLSTFYLFNQDYEKSKPEIDILEYIGTRPEKAYHTYHYYDSNRARYFSGEKHSSPTMESALGVNLSDDFHTYSVLWEPELVVWYIDGQEVRRITGVRVSDEPMNIIVQLVVGSTWIGPPDESKIPAEFEIDYIRAWQKQ